MNTRQVMMISKLITSPGPVRRKHTISRWGIVFSRRRVHDVVSPNLLFLEKGAWDGKLVRKVEIPLRQRTRMRQYQRLHWYWEVCRVWRKEKLLILVRLRRWLDFSSDWMVHYRDANIWGSPKQMVAKVLQGVGHPRCEPGIWQSLDILLNEGTKWKICYISTRELFNNTRRDSGHYTDQSGGRKDGARRTRLDVPCIYLEIIHTHPLHVFEDLFNRILLCLADLRFKSLDIVVQRAF